MAKISQDHDFGNEMYAKYISGKHHSKFGYFRLYNYLGFTPNNQQRTNRVTRFKSLNTTEVITNNKSFTGFIKFSKRYGWYLIIYHRNKLNTSKIDRRPYL